MNGGRFVILAGPAFIASTHPRFHHCGMTVEACPDSGGVIRPPVMIVGRCGRALV
jgi:hypothetical protein